MKITALWDMTLCSLVKCYHVSEEKACLSLQDGILSYQKDDGGTLL